MEIILYCVANSSISIVKRTYHKATDCLSGNAICAAYGRPFAILVPDTENFIPLRMLI